MKKLKLVYGNVLRISKYVFKRNQVVDVDDTMAKYLLETKKRTVKVGGQLKEIYLFEEIDDKKDTKKGGK